MKNFVYALMLTAAVLATTPSANAQCADCVGGGFESGGTGITDNANAQGIGNCVDQCRWPCTGNCRFTNGNTNVACPKFRGFDYSNKYYRGYLAATDDFHPDPFYAYSKSGIDASRIDQWNRVRASQTAWHGQYNYWRFNAPTALVVPPTASFQTSYSWGVGGTKSLPINHQFNSPASGGSGGISQQFSSPPYWPSSTDQLGVYPVRAPWSHVR